MCERRGDIASFHTGTHGGLGPNHDDVALVADFTEQAAFRRYIDSPAHQAYVREHASQVVSGLAGVQHELPG